VPTQSVDPRTGEPFGPELADTTVDELDRIVGRCADAADDWARVGPGLRAGALRAAADALDAAAPDLVPLADRETGLGAGRLTGELARSSFQLRMFADAVERGLLAGVVLDPEVAGPPPAGHPDLRRILVPIGPVAVYGASNFPFAFSVPGGDTASALAAGCPVVVKAHPGHPQTSAATGVLLAAALERAGAPAGTLGLVQGMAAGRALVQHRAIKAAAFTGSYSGGRALFDLAAGRPDPIPFYGELGSVNPVVVTPAAAARGAALAAEYVDSLTLGTGQFCTNPGLLLLPAGSGLTELVATEAAAREPGVMLHAGVAALFRGNVSRLAGLPGVRTLVDRSGSAVPGAHSGAVVLAVDAATAAATPELLRTECFGPAGLLVEYASTQELLAVLRHLEGCLVATVHADETEPLAAVVVASLARISGRVVWNGWPTGVAVTAAQQHGGPHPATTNALHTSVGTAAAQRFLRPVAYQSVPAALLPVALRG
jgi:acyl-CoA reductase-like NAD-dependent aldehyde dehydrogenase